MKSARLCCFCFCTLPSHCHPARILLSPAWSETTKRIVTCCDFWLQFMFRGCKNSKIFATVEMRLPDLLVEIRHLFGRLDLNPLCAMIWRNNSQRLQEQQRTAHFTRANTRHVDNVLAFRASSNCHNSAEQLILQKPRWFERTRSSKSKAPELRSLAEAPSNISPQSCVDQLLTKRGKHSLW